MLTSLSLRNFKCFESADIPLGRITVLIGPNGSGKSSFLQALALLRQSLGQSKLQFSGSLVDVSGFDDLVYRRDVIRDCEIQFSGSHMKTEDNLSYEYQVVFDEVLRRIVYQWNTGGDQSQYSWRGTDRSMTISMNDTQYEIPIKGLIGKHVDVDMKGAVIHDEDGKFSIEEVLNLPGRVIKSWMYTPIARGFTRSSYTMAHDEIRELRGDWDLSSSASNLASAIAYNDSVESMISNWIGQVTGVAINARALPGQRVLVRSSGNSVVGSIPIVNEGFGSGGLTFMLFQLVNTPRGGLDMIEEPELHLHPYAIARLADLLTAEAVKSDKQLLLTTHSEHLLLGLLNNVAEGKLAHTDLVVLSTSLGEDGAHVEQVKINEDGLAEGGLPGFFDATIEAQRRHLDALMNRA